MNRRGMPKTSSCQNQNENYFNGEENTRYKHENKEKNHYVRNE